MSAGAARSEDGSRTWTRGPPRKSPSPSLGSRRNLANVKGVGGGVLEYRIDWGAGYRVYFGRDGGTLVILLAGGTKRRQQRDVAAAQERWADYRRRRKEQT